MHPRVRRGLESQEARTLAVFQRWATSGVYSIEPRLEASCFGWDIRPIEGRQFVRCNGNANECPSSEIHGPFLSQKEVFPS